jgi:DNA-binding NarL/FixJ family response regulator
MKTDMNHKKLILVVNPPGALQIGLQAILTSHLDVDVLAVSEIESAIKVIKRYKPTLVILDQNISKTELPAIVSQIKDKWPEILVLVLVNDDKSLKLFEQSDADLVLIKGMSGSKLVENITDLLG